MELPQIHEDSKYIDNLLEMLELTEKSNVLPGKLSGGQQQRVAVARAMVMVTYNPHLIHFMDRVITINDGWFIY